MAYNPSAKKQAEIRRLNKLIQNKENRIRTKIPEAKGIYGESKFDVRRVDSFKSTADVNKYLKTVENALDRNNYRLVATGNEKIPFLPRQVQKAFENTQKKVNQSISGINDKIKEVSDRAIASSSGMTLSQYKRIEGRVVAGSKSGISGYGADFIKNSTNKKFLKEKMERAATKKLNEVSFEKKKMEQYQKLYSDNLKKHFTDDEGNISKEGRKLANKVKKMDVNRFASLFYAELMPNMDDWFESREDIRLVSQSKVYNNVNDALTSNMAPFINYDKEQRRVPKNYRKAQNELQRALKETSDIKW